MKKKYLLGLALLPLCLGGCASNNFNTELVVYCSHYYFAYNPNSGTQWTYHYNYIDCESCVGLATKEEKANNDNYEKSPSMTCNAEVRVESHIEAKAGEGWAVINYELLELPCDNSYHIGASSSYSYNNRHRHYLVTYAK